MVVGGTSNREHVAAEAPGKKVVEVVAVGYGQAQGKPHKSKTSQDISSYAGEEPGWFADGVKAALLAPTALDKGRSRLRERKPRLHHVR